MIDLLWSFFKCPCTRHTWPITVPGRSTYVVCLDCGREYGYDMEAMKRIGRILHIASPDVIITGGHINIKNFNEF